MKKTVLIFAIGLLCSSKLFAQNPNTIGQSKEYIRNLIKSNPNFKLLTGEKSDTLSFAEGMQAIFFYKDNICYRSISILRLKYESSITEKMTTDAYKKTNDSTWVDPKQTMRVVITENKPQGICFVTTTGIN